MEESIRSFVNMLLDCHGVWSWCFDGEGNVLFQNSLQPKLHRAILLSQGRPEAIHAHFAENTMPLILNDGLGFMWAAVCAAPGEAVYVIGPVIPGNVTSQQIQQMLEPLNLTVKKKIDILNCVPFIPKMTTDVFFQHVVALHYYVHGKKCRISDFVYLSANLVPPKRYQGAAEMEMRPWPHSPKMNEEKLFEMVRTGNLEYQDALAAAASGSPGIRMEHGDPLQRAKYSVVAFTTLCSRAAMEGGLSSEVAYTLCDTYTASVDACTSVSQVASVSHTMFDDYVRRVNKCRRESGISRPIRICCDYIDIHPTREMSLEELAGQTGYTPYYLSRKFKQEMGMTVAAYIRRARIHHARQLLRQTDMKIQEISDLLHFCSKSYFAEVFQKETGMSPNDYRIGNDS